MNRSELRIHSFLRMGYFMDYSLDLYPIDLSRVDKQAYDSADREELIHEGVRCLDATFDGLFSSAGNHVVPISGGLDSRLVLAALLERADASSIQTYTYGIRGSYDFEIGGLVASAAGTRHTAIPLNEHDYRTDELMDTVRRTQCQAMLFHHPPLWFLDGKYSGAQLWSGYVGDAVAGSYLFGQPSTTIGEARRVHLRRRTFVKSVRLWEAVDEDFLPHLSFVEAKPGDLTLDEQFVFGEAAAKFTAPLVLFDGFDWKTPLINTPWMDFMFSLPDEYRLGQTMMIDVALFKYSRLFGLPCKNRVGHTLSDSKAAVKRTFWFNRVRKRAHQFIPSVNWPNHQYNDFNEGIRSNPGLRDIVRGSIHDLRRRGICDWVDFDGIWRRHERRLRNHGDALIVLTSLELVLKALEAE